MAWTRKRTKKTFRKKRVFKRRPRSRRRPQRSQIVSLGRSPFPKKALIKFRYTDQLLLDAAIGGTALHTFRANSLFDPDHTSTGHQPLGFDQWMTFYNRFTVIGAKITAVFATNDAANNTALQVSGIILRNTTGALGSTDQIMEQPDCNYKYLGQPTSANGIVRVSKSFSAKKWFTVKDVLDEDDLSGDASTDPVEQAYFTVWTGAQVLTTNPQPVAVNVIVEYVAVLHDPKLLSQS